MAHKCAAEKSYALLHQTPPPPPTIPPLTTVPLPTQQLTTEAPSTTPTTTRSPEVLFSTLADKIIPQISNVVIAPQSNYHRAIANPKLDYFCEILNRIREPIVLYEEQKGVPRDL